MESKFITGYENIYKVYENGDIYSLDREEKYYREDMDIWCTRTRKGRKLKPHKTSFGYYTVNLQGKDVKIHRIVASEFIPNPENKPQVNHIDGNKANNSVSNLEWATAKENSVHSWKNGLQKQTENNLRYYKSVSKKVAQYDLDGNLINVFDSINEAERFVGDNGHISKCCNHKEHYKTIKGFKWEFIEEVV